MLLVMFLLYQIAGGDAKAVLHKFCPFPRPVLGGILKRRRAGSFTPKCGAGAGQHDKRRFGRRRGIQKRQARYKTGLPYSLAEIPRYRSNGAHLARSQAHSSSFRRGLSISYTWAW